MQYSSHLLPYWFTSAGLLEARPRVPRLTKDEKFVSVPLVLPMGWENSNPAFYAATETIADIPIPR